MWLSTVIDEHLIGVVRVHGGVKFYRGAAKAARAYVEGDRSGPMTTTLARAPASPSA
jgi:hypothetical protein